MITTDWDTPDHEELLFESGPPRRRKPSLDPKPNRRTAVLLSASERAYLRGVAHHLGQASDTTVAVSGVLRAIVSAVSKAGLDLNNCRSVSELEDHLLQLLKGDKDV